jgi:uncharacterized membrane protein YbhN (UPF0104 family)
MPEPQLPSEPAVSKPSRRKRLWMVARAAITIALVALLIRMVSLDELVAAVRRIPLQALLLCLLACCVSQVLGGIRFRWLLSAYGASSRLPWTEAVRLQLVSLFFNTYLPGGVAGDLVRSVALRGYFDGDGLTRSFAVSFVERVMGGASVLILTAAVSVVHPLPGIHGLLLFSVLGLVVATLATLALALGRRLAPRLPARLSTIAAGLPSLENPLAFVQGLVISVLTHVCVALGFHAVISSLSERASLVESLVIVPLASTAAYIPATIAGAGTRDAAFVMLYARVGVSQADALAMSLSVLFCTFLVAALGGIAHAIGPLQTSKENR